MPFRPVSLLALSSVVACAAAGTNHVGNGGDDTGEAAVTGPDNVVLDDSSDGLSIAITGGSASGWLLGVLGSSGTDEGESCHDAGDLCHTLGAGGGTLSWCSTPTDSCTAVAELYYREGIETLVLKPEVGLGCWTWGESASAYADLGCTATDWDPSSY